MKVSHPNTVLETEETQTKPKGTHGPPVEISQLREQIATEVGNSALPMVKGAIADCGKGHYLAMKYLFEMIGLYPATAPVESGTEDSLTKILLRNLGIWEKSDELGEAQTKVTKESLLQINDGASPVVE